LINKLKLKTINMKRWDIINAYVDKYGYKDYLEIGLCSGMCRDAVKAENKTTVDPSDRSDNPTHLMTSDRFFQINKNKFDIIFIDGLHEAPQVYKDILNALECLNEGGTILCHDMLPTSEIVQRVPRAQAIWTGNCWAAWAKLRGRRQDLEMFVVNTDWGVGVIRKGEQEICEELDVPFADMTWEFFKEHKSKFNHIEVGEFLKQMEEK
jgi:hypothetical protein